MSVWGMTTMAKSIGAGACGIGLERIGFGIGPWFGGMFMGLAGTLWLKVSLDSQFLELSGMGVFPRHSTLGGAWTGMRILGA